jgi:peptidoglycan/LPS O-acetylase OafA/YrhL
MQNTLSFPLPQAPVKLDSKVRLNYLHGIRGIAALYVVLFHIYLDYQSMLSVQGAQLPLWIQSLLGLLSEGHAAVAVFILLSGYCLLLPSWRRFGVVPLLVTAFGLSVLLHDFLPFSSLITLFALE